MTEKEAIYETPYYNVYADIDKYVMQSNMTGIIEYENKLLPVVIKTADDASTFLENLGENGLEFSREVH